MEPRTASPAFKTAVATAIGQQGAVISLHTADPGETGANEVTGSGYVRVLTVWGASAIVNTVPDVGKARITGTKITFNVPGNQAITHFGVRAGTVGSPGAFLYGNPLTPGATLSAAGQLDVTPSHLYDLV